MGAVLQKLGFGGDEGGGDAAVKRQAEGLSNPMYQLANLMGQVLMFLQSTVPLIKTRQFDQNQATNKTQSIDLAFVSINLIKLYFDILLLRILLCFCPISSNKVTSPYIEYFFIIVIE